MDRKSIIVIAACLVTLVLWVTVVIPKFTPPRTAPPAGTNAAASAVVTPASAPATPSLAAAAAAPSFTASTSAPEELLVVTNENARYTFTTHGGGLKEIALVQYPEKISHQNMP